MRNNKSLITLNFASRVLIFVICSFIALPIASQQRKTTSIQKSKTTVTQSQKKKVQDSKKKKDPVVGMFVCKKTGDKYLFDDDGTGYFYSSGSNTSFKWQHKGELVIVSYEAFGKTYLYFDAKKRQLKEDSKIFGLLVFNKI